MPARDWYRPGMRLLLINPNSTQEMTATIAGQASAIAGVDTEIRAVNPVDTPPAIQGVEDGEAALPGLFALFDREVASWNPSAVVIACFDDTGLIELKIGSDIPVIGIGEAAFHAAMLLGGNFSVVTTLAVSVPVITKNIDFYGISARCAGVRASGVPVLDLENSRVDAFNIIADEIERSLLHDKPDSIVLGCAGMAGLAGEMSERFGMPVVDGVTAATVLAEAIINLQRPENGVIEKKVKS